MSVQPFNPQALQDTLKERVKAIFGDLVPDHEWERMLTIQTNAFMREELPKLVREALTAESRKVISAWFASADWKHTWNPVTKQNMIPQVLREIVGENLESFAHLMFKNLMSQTLMNTFTQIHNEIGNQMQNHRNSHHNGSGY